MADDSKLPKHLYKYRSWSDLLHKRIITHNEIWFASPRSFNDPFDCQIPMQYRKLTHEQRVDVYLEALSTSATPEQKAKFATEADGWAQMLSDMTDQQYHKWLNTMQRERDAKTGIFTASSEDKDILMWSHYSDSHKGFCVEFVLEKLVDRVNQYKGIDFMILPHEVKYPDDYPILLPLAGPHNNAYLDRNIIKSGKWTYENEWRFITFKETDFSVPLPKGIITKVILGCEMPDSDQEDIKHELLKQGGDILLEKAVKAKDEFGLDFEPVDY